mmetsp:Transcript_1787/g.1240  ORF Transcript_1787/g.1240 Transcript_1787/m.1240 type:complete len:97 (+) Transcript_1787:246-536(+)
MRRYRDFDWLHTVLKCKYLACIVPPIPPKAVTASWVGDESDLLKQRKAGLDRFLQKMIKHRIMCGSEDLRALLTMSDGDFERRKREMKERLPETQD